VRRRRCVHAVKPRIHVGTEAAINAVHADATILEQTDWSQIVALYDQLLAVAIESVVELRICRGFRLPRTGVRREPRTRATFVACRGNDKAGEKPGFAGIS
jgi:predicted RNA polymerase sigma factor